LIGLRGVCGSRVHTVLPALAFPDHDLGPCEIDILHPQAHTLHEPHPRPVEEADHQSHRAAQMPRESIRPPRASGPSAGARAASPTRRLRATAKLPEDLLVEEQDRTLGWFCVEADIPFATARWVRNPSTSAAPMSRGVVMQHEAPDPVDIRPARSECCNASAGSGPGPADGVVRHPYDLRRCACLPALGATIIRPSA